MTAAIVLSVRRVTASAEVRSVVTARIPIGRGPRGKPGNDGDPGDPGPPGPNTSALWARSEW